MLTVIRQRWKWLTVFCWVSSALYFCISLIASRKNKIRIATWNKMTTWERNAFCEITKKRGLEGERIMSRRISDQHVEIINQLGLQTAEESRLEHLELKQGVFFSSLAHIWSSCWGEENWVRSLHLVPHLGGYERDKEKQNCSCKWSSWSFITIFWQVWKPINVGRLIDDKLRPSIHDDHRFRHRGSLLWGSSGYSSSSCLSHSSESSNSWSENRQWRLCHYIQNPVISATQYFGFFETGDTLW